MNQFIVHGNIGRAPEIKVTEENYKIASFSVADYKGKDKQGEAITQWWSCVAFGKTAEYIEKKAHAGSMVTIFGTAENGTYTDKTGEKRVYFRIFVNRIAILNRDAASGKEAEVPREAMPIESSVGDGFMQPTMDDEMPF